MVDLNQWTLPSLKARRAIEHLKQLPQGARVLDYGCGEGKMIRTVKRHLPQVVLSGVDVQAPLEKPEFEFSLIDKGKTGLEKGAYSAVMAIDVLEHVPESDIKQTLQEIKTLLRKDGKFIVFLPLEGKRFGPYRLFRFLLGQDLYKETKMHLLALEEAEAIKLLERDFEIESICYSYHFFGAWMDSAFFALCKINALKEWWYKSNSLYHPTIQKRKGLLNRLMEIANAVCFVESTVLRNVPLSSAGLHVVAKPKYAPIIPSAAGSGK